MRVKEPCCLEAKRLSGFTMEMRSGVAGATIPRRMGRLLLVLGHDIGNATMGISNSCDIGAVQLFDPS
jgi:hypothetical protein